MEKQIQEYNLKLYRIFKTTIEMLQDRNFAIPDNLLKLALQEFVNKYKTNIEVEEEGKI